MSLTKVACLGPHATFTHFAARQAFGDNEEVKYDFMSQYNGCQAVLKGKVEYAVIPIENNVGGFVDASLDALYKTSRITVSKQIYLSIDHHLISKEMSIGDIDTVYSHPQAIAQCNKKLKELESIGGKDIKRVFVSSTAEGVNVAANHERCAAIASREASEYYKIPILQESFHDYPGNKTRFYVIQLGKISTPTEKDRSAFLVEVKNSPGALASIINKFAKNNVNLLSLATRPSRKSPSFDWSYAFFMECEGHAHVDPLDKIFRYFQEERDNYQTRKLRLLGSFPSENAPKIVKNIQSCHLVR